jgi:hypothetical protein
LLSRRDGSAKEDAIDEYADAVDEYGDDAHSPPSPLSAVSASTTASSRVRRAARKLSESERRAPRDCYEALAGAKKHAHHGESVLQQQQHAESGLQSDSALAMFASQRRRRRNSGKRNSGNLKPASRSSYNTWHSIDADFVEDDGEGWSWRNGAWTQASQGSGQSAAATRYDTMPTPLPTTHAEHEKYNTDSLLCAVDDAEKMLELRKILDRTTAAQMMNPSTSAEKSRRSRSAPPEHMLHRTRSTPDEFGLASTPREENENTNLYVWPFGSRMEQRAQQRACNKETPATADILKKIGISSTPYPQVAATLASAPARLRAPQGAAPTRTSHPRAQHAPLGKDADSGVASWAQALSLGSASPHPARFGALLRHSSVSPEKAWRPTASANVAAQDRERETRLSLARQPSKKSPSNDSLSPARDSLRQPVKGWEAGVPTPKYSPMSHTSQAHTSQAPLVKAADSAAASWAQALSLGSASPHPARFATLLRHSPEKPREHWRPTASATVAAQDRERETRLSLARQPFNRTLSNDPLSAGKPTAPVAADARGGDGGEGTDTEAQTQAQRVEAVLWGKDGGHVLYIYTTTILVLIYSILVY